MEFFTVGCKKYESSRIKAMRFGKFFTCWCFYVCNDEFQAPFIFIPYFVHGKHRFPALNHVVIMNQNHNVGTFTDK